MMLGLNMVWEVWKKKSLIYEVFIENKKEKV
jgi:hypothetical protein